MITVENHMHALQHEAPVVVLERQDTLAAQDARPFLLNEILHPGKELVRIERLVERERDRLHLLVVIVLKAAAGVAVIVIVIVAMVVVVIMIMIMLVIMSMVVAVLMMLGLK